MMLMCDEKSLPVVHSAQDLTITFPAKNNHISNVEAEKNRCLIKEQGVYTNGGQTYIDKNALPHLLATDKKGINRLYNSLDNADKLELGQQQFVSVPAINKEISKRLQEPRDTLQRERLRDTEGCVNAMRDAPELEKIREVEESKNRKEQSNLKAKKIKAENITACQITGEPLQPDADAHHITRQADEPRRARDLDNVLIVNKSTHQAIHAASAESPEELSQLCRQNGWSDPTQS